MNLKQYRHRRPFRVHVGTLLVGLLIGILIMLLAGCHRESQEPSVSRQITYIDSTMTSIRLKIMRLQAERDSLYRMCKAKDRYIKYLKGK